MDDLRAVWVACVCCNADIEADVDQNGRFVTLLSRECSNDPYAPRCILTDTELLARLNTNFGD